MLGEKPDLFQSRRHDDEFHAAIWAEAAECGHWQGEVWSCRKDGTEYPQWLSMSFVADAGGRAAHFIASFIDITRRKDAEDSIRRLALLRPADRPAQPPRCSPIALHARLARGAAQRRADAR
ncbi:MAG: PAS domain S-box protein [Comamonadaceae bacterium]|nr:PAS domain S-box protein [Comamonadaceae bacterium]